MMVQEDDGQGYARQRGSSGRQALQQCSLLGEAEPEPRLQDLHCSCYIIAVNS